MKQYLNLILVFIVGFLAGHYVWQKNPLEKSTTSSISVTKPLQKLPDIKTLNRVNIVRALYGSESIEYQQIMNVLWKGGSTHEINHLCDEADIALRQKIERNL